MRVLHDANLFPISKTIRMNSADGSLLNLIATDMPSRIRDDLERNLIIAMGATSDADSFALRESDSSQDPQPFSAIHFSYYARSATKVRSLNQLIFTGLTA